MHLFIKEIIKPAALVIILGLVGFWLFGLFGGLIGVSLGIINQIGL